MTEQNPTKPFSRSALMSKNIKEISPRVLPRVDIWCRAVSHRVCSRKTTYGWDFSTIQEKELDSFSCWNLRPKILQLTKKFKRSRLFENRLRALSAPRKKLRQDTTGRSPTHPRACVKRLPMHKNFSVPIFFSLNGSANSRLTKYETSSVHLQLQHQYTGFISHKARNSPAQRHCCHSSAGPRRETPLLDHTIKILLFVSVLASFFFFDLDV